MSLNDIPWGEAAEDGSQFALLEGDRVSPDPFAYAFRIPAGMWDPAHTHSQDAWVFVASGVLKIGFGTEDHSKFRSFGAGSLLRVPAHAIHSDGSDEDTIILGLSKGPWSTQYLGQAVSASAGTPTADN